MTVIEVFLFLLLAVAIVMDLTSDRIPNWLIVMGTAVGLWQSDQFCRSILLYACIVLIFFPFFGSGALGAGDVKCFAMISLYLTFSCLLWALFFTFLFATIFSVYRILQNRSFFLQKSKIHLAVPIFLGVVFSVGGTHL